MLLKIFGSFMILFSSILLGILLSDNIKKRPKELRELQVYLNMFENELMFLENLLSDVLKKISELNNGRTAVFFENANKILLNEDNITAHYAWEKAVRQNIHKTALNKEDEEILVSLGKILGRTNLEGQINNLKLTVSQLKIQEQKAEESRKKNELMTRNLAILSGIALVVLLF